MTGLLLKKFPGLSEPNASYHGIRFAQDVGAAAFVTRIRAILLRDTGGDPLTLPRLFVFTGAGDTFLRVERHVENALKVVEYLNAHPQVEAVHHQCEPGSGPAAALQNVFPQGRPGSIFTF